MSIQFYTSGNIHALGTQLAADIQSKQKSIFLPTTIITQVEGINSWLKLYIAKQNKVAANLQFGSPTDLISKIFFLLGGNYANMVSSANVVWVVYKILLSSEFQHKFKNISAYYTNNVKVDEVKVLDIAKLLADLFDQYQIYRPQLIQNWNDGGDAGSTWQAYVWQQANRLTHNQILDKTKQQQYIIDALANKEQLKKLQANLPNVYLFGLDVLSPSYVNLLHTISNHIDLHFYMVNPAPNVYWFYDKSAKDVAKISKKYKQHFTVGNNLLLNLGSVPKNTLTTFFEHDSFLNALEILPDKEQVITTHKQTLLHTIQADLKQALPDTDVIKVDKTILADDTISINSCSSPVREVEVLYNFLIKILLENPSKFSLRDIAIYSPNIALYAPYIESIFSNAPIPLHVSITDLPERGANNEIDALLNILNLQENNITSANILDLVGFASIQNKFGLTDTEIINETLLQAGIRMGLENNHTNDTYLVSIKEGLNRLLYGLFLGASLTEQNETIIQNTQLKTSKKIVPITITEGLGSTHIINLIYFLKQLEAALKLKRSNKTVAEWCGYVGDVLDTFIISENQTDEQGNIAHLQELLSSLSTAQQYVEEKIPFTIFNSYFNTLAAHFNKQQHYFTNAITASSLGSLRNVPFKIIALLGIDNHTFPRKDRYNSFDLIKNKPQIGDRNIKENDKSIFLDSLLTAGDYFFMSYQGYTATDLTLIPPSIVTDSLVNYIENYVKPADADWFKHSFIQKQPLHGYSAVYNHSKFSITNRHKKPISYLNEIPNRITPEPKQIINFKSVINFYTNTIKYYYNHVLGIYFDNDNANIVPTTEIFELDTLGQSEVRKKWITYSQNDFENYFELQNLKGSLPLKNASIAWLDEQKKILSINKQYFDKLTQKETAQNVTVSLSLQNQIIDATIPNLYQQKIVQVSASKKTDKHLQNTVLHFLLAQYTNQASQAYLLNVHPENNVTLQLNPTANQLEYITQLLTNYTNFNQTLIPYASNFLDINLKTYTYEKWLGDVTNANGKMANDAYWQHALHNNFFTEKAFEKFLELTNNLQKLTEHQNISAGSL